MATVHIKYMHFVFHEKSRANVNVKGSKSFDDLIPTSLLLQLEARRNFETFIGVLLASSPLQALTQHSKKTFQKEVM